MIDQSLPSRERGLKSVVGENGAVGRNVAPFTGAWIEICRPVGCSTERCVAPFTGAWIEISEQAGQRDKGRVAPFTGAWIEICDLHHCTRPARGRSLHGSVD